MKVLVRTQVQQLFPGLIMVSQAYTGINEMQPLECIVRIASAHNPSNSVLPDREIYLPKKFPQKEQIHFGKIIVNHLSELGYSFNYRTAG